MSLDHYMDNEVICPLLSQLGLIENMSQYELQNCQYQYSGFITKRQEFKSLNDKIIWVLKL